MAHPRFASIAVLLAVAACAAPAALTSLQAPQSRVRSEIRASAPVFKVFTAGETPGFPATASANDITRGPNGSMWFTDGGTPAIGRIASDGTVTEFTQGLPAGAGPYAIVAGRDGNMWFSDYRGVAIGEVTPAGTITEFDAPQYTNSHAMGISVDARGQPWIVGFGSQPLLAHLTKQKTIVADLLPVRMTPFGALATGPAGVLWFVATNAHGRGDAVEFRAHKDRLRRMPMHMQRAEEPCCPNTAPKSIAVGAAGDPWFTTLDFIHGHSQSFYLGRLESRKVKLLRIRAKGLTETAIPSGLAAAGTGFWMTGGDPLQSNGALWHFSADGKQTVYNLPYDPLGLAVDAAGRPWFTAAFPGQPSQIVEVTSL